jgi:diadenosine tetraphosphate (Ap4A) HIT family hydrolase
VSVHPVVPSAADCPLCREDGGRLIARHAHFRVIRATGADAADFPGFYRVVWNAHVAEWSDLSEADQVLCMRAVTAVERVVREHLRPTKVNLAALGNVVPHLHWHVVARHDWDSRFPAPLWAPATRPADADRLTALRARLPACDAALATALAAAFTDPPN